MGYFSNGTEGAIYEERYCVNCIHYGDKPEEGNQCSVWDAHLLYNYVQFDQPIVKSVLEMLIPRKEIGNGQCKLFVKARE